MPKEKRPKMWEFMTNSGVGAMFGKLNAAGYKATGGKMFGKMGDAELAILTTIGRKSGKPRTVPLVRGSDGANVVFIASKAGHPTHPLWYLNLVANPEVKILIGDREQTYIARTVDGPDRERLWKLMVAMYADYDNYQKWTDRQIPVVLCEPKP